MVLDAVERREDVLRQRAFAWRSGDIEAVIHFRPAGKHRRRAEWQGRGLVQSSCQLAGAQDFKANGTDLQQIARGQ